MYNYNFGGIKGSSPQGDTANYLTHEVIGGQNLTVRQGFRAYGSIDEGAEDYVRLLSHQFGPALSSAKVGDVRGFAHALKQAGYYTSSEDQYASALQSLAGPARPATENLQPVPSMQAAVSGATFPASDDLSRVLDAISNSALHPSVSGRDDP
jgi:flagellum-specific peptidoglycan hydrolase FlgJ